MVTNYRFSLDYMSLCGAWDAHDHLSNALSVAHLLRTLQCWPSCFGILMTQAWVTDINNVMMILFDPLLAMAFKWYRNTSQKSLLTTPYRLDPMLSEVGFAIITTGDIAGKPSRHGQFFMVIFNPCITRISRAID